MFDVAPNTSPFPSALPNSPFFSPYLQVPNGEILDVQSVPETAGVVDPFTHHQMTPQGPNNMLARLRAEFPYVPFVPLPNQVRTVALIQNVARDIPIPDGAAAIQLHGSGTYYVSNNGNAEIPTAANDFTSLSIYKPERFAFYIAGIKSLSVISSDANCVVTLIAFVPAEMPR